MSFKIKARPTGFKKLLLATQKRGKLAVGDFAITEAWLRFVLSLRPIHRQQLVTRTGVPWWDGPQSLAGKRVLLFAPRTFPDVPASAGFMVGADQKPGFSRVKLAVTAAGEPGSLPCGTISRHGQ